LRKRAPWHFERDSAYDLLTGQFGTRDLGGFGIEDEPAAIIAAGALLQYAQETQRTALPHLRAIQMENPHGHLHLDATTRRNLELLHHPEGRDEHTLAGIMDSTVTPMGGRLLRRWIAEPIRDRQRLQLRHNSIGVLLDTRLFETLRGHFRSVGDIERILARVALGSARPRDLTTLRQALGVLPEIKAGLISTEREPLPVRLRRLWTMLAHLQGETINYSKLASNLEVDAKTVSHYIDILTELLLVRRLEPWHANVKKRLVKSPRYYVRDSGILHRLLGISSYDALLSNPVLGKSWEGFAIENILSVLHSRSESYFYRTAAGAEVDLVIKMPSSETWAIEIKYGVAPKIGKHYSQTCDDVGATHKYIVYGGNDEFAVGNDVKIISLTGLMKRLRSG